MPGRSVLLILGGMFHDFDGFEAAMRPVLEEHGHAVYSTFDLDKLLELESGEFDVVMAYTSLSRHREGMPTDSPESLTPEQTNALIDWVRRGGALLGVHGATVMGRDNPPLEALIGGRFREHPPQFAFTVTPMSGPHPITAGVEAFAVKDELYVQDYDPSVHIHMVTVDRGIAHPMVWSRTERRGRVAHVSIGHSDLVWSLAPFRRLVLQAIDWLTDRG